MCGRFTLHSRNHIRLEAAQILDLPFEARYNIAPSQQVSVIADFGYGPEVKTMVWGLFPSWSTDGKGFINARAETLGEKAELQRVLSIASMLDTCGRLL